MYEVESRGSKVEGREVGSRGSKVESREAEIEKPKSKGKMSCVDTGGVDVDGDNQRESCCRRGLFGGGIGGAELKQTVVKLVAFNPDKMRCRVIQLSPTLHSAAVDKKKTLADLTYA